MVPFFLIDSVFIPRRLIAPFADDGGGLATWKHHSSKYNTFSRRGQMLPLYRFNSILTLRNLMRPKATLPAFQPFIREERARARVVLARDKARSARSYATYSTDLGDRLRGDTRNRRSRHQSWWEEYGKQWVILPTNRDGAYSRGKLRTWRALCILGDAR